ncbi:DNA translocase FtsK [Amylibacter sp. SFDW26]|uniref:DNA translocase FtsK n=1 Tax=Amylibacter sp. SFDW26 TaxID=2652722 RepID=UPI00126281ED|nr:DNA translocase FtsK [Amylibacter sp. SFDW26]KAB7614487.1 DNA translocase FtsK [Amylibacter sp. SFDW26]
MAYQSRPRDPLLEEHMQAAIRKRGSELIGLGLLAIGVLFALIMWSYSPDDPSRFNVTSAPAKNMLGEFGAAIASTLILTMGKAAWTIPLFMVTWGVRFVLHIGETRAVSRVIFSPIFAAFAAIFMAAHVPADAWTHSFGLGGLFGDMALGFLVDINPLSLGFGVALITLVLAAITVSLGLYVLGYTIQELRTINRYAIVAIILSYASIINLISMITSKVQQHRANRPVRTSATDIPQAQPETSFVARAEPSLVEEYIDPVEAAPVEEQAPAKKLSFPSLPTFGLGKRAEPEMVAETAHVEPQLQTPSQDRVKMRITEAVQSKILAKRNEAQDQARVEPVLVAEPAMAPPTSQEPIMAKEFTDDGELDLNDPVENIFAVPTPEPKAVVQHTTPKPVQKSKKAKAEAQPSLFADKNGAEYETPPLGLLASPTTIVRHHLSDEALEQNARMLETVLDDYGVKGEIVSVRPGPVVTMYELEPAPGLKASRVIGLADDIARSMSALSARVSTVPGRTVVGIELPNENRETVLLREMLAGKEYGDGNHGLPLALGKDIGGEPIIANLAKMPHLLIAGTTGSGKSVAINTMILSLLYKLSPEDCRMIMIDPKMLELSVYDGIPHLLSPVVTDPKKAVVALKWVVGEMEERYRKMSKMGVRNVGGYNARVEDALKKGEDFERTVQTGFAEDTGEPIFETETFKPEKLPFIVVIVDEMADLMMVAGKEIEACIQRLAQMARASGIHLIMATQRPSVDVITGTIKANFPTRISFQVTSKIDSRTILGEMGAEQLLGMGDMLYMEGGGKITRVHGPFASDEEVEEVVNHLKSFGAPEYIKGVVDGPESNKESDIDAVLGLGGNTGKEDALYDQAVAIVAKDRKCSTSYIQRKLSIGYNKAAKIVEEMEDQGIVSAANHVGKRDILLPE